MKTSLTLTLLLACTMMNGQEGLGIIKPSLLEITETASAFDAKVKEAYMETASAFDAKIKETYKDYPLPGDPSSDEEISEAIRMGRLWTATLRTSPISSCI